MAEENHGLYDETTHDDQSVMRQLLMTVKGLSPTSMAPMADSALAQSQQSIEQFQFE